MSTILIIFIIILVLLGVGFIFYRSLEKKEISDYDGDKYSAQITFDLVEPSFFKDSVFDLTTSSDKNYKNMNGEKGIVIKKDNNPTLSFDVINKGIALGKVSFELVVNTYYTTGTVSKIGTSTFVFDFENIGEKVKDNIERTDSFKSIPSSITGIYGVKSLKMVGYYKSNELPVETPDAANFDFSYNITCINIKDQNIPAIDLLVKPTTEFPKIKHCLSTECAKENFGNYW